MDELTLHHQPWYDLAWLSMEQLRSFTWAHEVYLYGLIALPCLWIGMWWWQRRKYVRIACEPTAWRTLHDVRAYLRHVLPLTAMACLAFLLIALARPQRVEKLVDKWREGIDIILAIDISKSMEIEDLAPNRLQAAKRVASTFVKGRTDDKIGLVIFSGDAFSKTPLTQDYDLLSEEIESIDFNLIVEQGTAIGSALAASTNRMRESTAISKVIILLSDGENTAGQIDPITAARLAAAYGLKIYTIAVGREGRVPWGRNMLGMRRYVESHIDEASLKEIAAIGGGAFYRATNSKALQQVFEEIDILERSEIKERRYFQQEDYYRIYLRWSMVCFLLFMLLKGTSVSNILQD